MDIQAYLSRIGLTNKPRPTLDGLRLLQDAHMRHVPFENLDILLGRPLNVSEGALFEKIISRKRGGYCFELFCEVKLSICYFMFIWFILKC